MLAADNDTNFDVYKRTAGTTTLASDGSAGTDPSTDATALGVSDDGTRVWFDTTEKILGTDTDAQFDIYERQGTTTTHVSSGTSAATAPSTRFSTRPPAMARASSSTPPRSWWRPTPIPPLTSTSARARR